MKLNSKGKGLISLLLSLVMILGIAPITAFAEDIQITKVELTYDAPVSPMYTHREWNNEYCKTLSFGTGTLAKNKSTSNYHLLVYDNDTKRYFHTTNASSDNPEEYREDANINPELTYYILADAYADTGYYFDSENLNDIEIWVNGKKCDNVIIEGYNEYWNSIRIYIPVTVDTSSLVKSISISQEGNSVTVGTTKQFSKEVKYYGTGYDEVVWQVSGGTSAETAIDSNGLLTVGEDETATSLTVKAISAMDSSVASNELTVYVQEKPLSIDSVSVSPTSQSIYKSYSTAFTASVDGTASHTVEWSIIGTTTDENTKITASGTDNLTGTLQIGENETATALTVRATSVADNTKYAEATVSILDQIKITKIELSYDTERAPFTSELTHRQWNDEYCKTLSFGTGTLVKNKSTSNYHLLVYDNDTKRYFHTTNASSDNPEEYRPDANINPDLTYYILANAFADTGYYFDTENLNDIEIWVNGKKYDNVIIQGYNSYWKSIELYIPVSKPTPPAKVTGLATTARGSGGRTLTLSWNAVDGTTGYNVYAYNKPADSWTLIGNTDTNKYIDETVKPSYEYYYRVAAVRDGVEGTPSDTLHTCAACETISTPSVIATNDKTIQVDWNLVGSHGYVVMWSKDSSFKTGTNYKYITGHSKNSYTISVPSGANQYYVRVRAWRNWDTGYVYGAWSEGVKSGQAVAKVTGLATTARGSGGRTLTLSWKAQSAADSYNVYAYNKPADSWTFLGNVTTNKFIDETVKPSYEYYYRVVAVKDGKESVPSDTLHTCAACETMKAPTTQKSGSQIKVGWELVGSHGYVVMWSTDPTFKTGTSYKYITGHSVNNYTITGIRSNQTYYVRVRAWRNWPTGYVYGAWSNGTKA